MHLFIVALLSCLFCLTIPAQELERSSWPTLHGNLQRHGFYASFPAQALKLAWRKELHDELTGLRAEVIVGGGLAFMGTYAGNMYAWDAASGEERWKIQTGAPIGHSPMYTDGLLFFGSMDGQLYAVHAVSGEIHWIFTTGEGIWTSPTVYKNLVFFGDRAGIFYALNAANGEKIWSYESGDRILTTASIDTDRNHVLFASEDMRLYCLNLHNGELIWKSKKLHGLSVRDYFPVIVKDLVFITTNPVKDFHTILDENQRMFLSWANFTGEDDRYIPGTQEDIRREQERIREYLQENPTEQIIYAFRLEDGTEPWIAPILYTGGLHNPYTPPCYNPERDEVYVYIRSAYGVWDGGGEVRSYTGVGKLHMETGFVELIEHGHNSKEPGRPAGSKDMPWMTFNTIGDETQTLASSPDTLFSIHQGFIGSMDFASGKTRNLYGKRDTYGGFYGPGNYGWEKDGGIQKAAAAGDPYGLVNEWHGPARAIVSVAGNRVYFPVGSQVICLMAQSN